MVALVSLKWSVFKIGMSGPVLCNLLTGHVETALEIPSLRSVTE